MTRLSNRQYPMLLALVDNGTDHYMNIEEAQSFDQRPFRSMLIQGWAAYRPGRGFHVTKEGIKALHEFLETDITRKDPTMPLTAYFDPTAYGLELKNKKRHLHVIPKKGAA
jgi:hypothetical protein